MEVYQRGAPSLLATWIGIALVGLFLFIGLITNVSTLILLSIMALALVVLLRLWAMLSTRKVRCMLSIDNTRVFAGEQITAAVTARNKKLLPLCLDMHVALDPSLGSVDGKRYLQAQTTLSSYGKVDFEWPITATKRGIYRVGPVKSASADLLGFFFCDHTGEEKGLEITVYPRLVPLAPLSLPRRDFFGIPGGEGLVDDPAYILGTTDYRHGSPAKFLHWKASARHHRLQQKVFEPTEQEKVMIVLDVGGYRDEQDREAFERTLEVVASLAVGLDRKGCAVGFLTNGVMNGMSPVIPISRSPARIVSVLEALARVTTEWRQPVAEMLPSFQIGWGATGIYFCRDHSSETALAKARFQRKRMPLVFMPFEKAERLRREGRGRDKAYGSGRPVVADRTRP